MKSCFFAAYESAWNKGMLTRTDREWIRRSVPARTRWLVDLARPDAESGLESLLRLRLIRLGVTLECQVLIIGVGRVDFLAAGRLIIEVDGRENHDGVSMRHKDLVRDAAAAAQGYETLRFDYALVMHEWHTVEKAIVTAVAQTWSSGRRAGCDRSEVGLRGSPVPTDISLRPAHHPRHPPAGDPPAASR